MKVLHTKTLKDGRKHLLVELLPSELAPVAAVREDAFYQLGYPMDDSVIAGHILKDPQRVVWDSLEQKWIDV